uniref:Pseudouridylate synthase RPUSD4, mitochondrial n=1 Tax=Lepisosteus oculatus TaxID=7918 RepID=W5M5M3_LEPOC
MCANLGEARSICVLAAVVARTLRPHSAATGQKRGLKTVVGRENTDSPKLKASDLAEKIRQEKKQPRETKTEGPSSPVLRRVRELHQFSQQLQRVHPNVLAKDLKRGMLLANEQLVAINKPYGVPVHGGPGVKNSIADVLPVLAKMIGGMKAGPLHLCHRLDKDTTGVMLLGKSEEAADHIHQLFKTHQVEKKYWVLSVGVPVPSEGVIDIPIIEKEVAGPQPHYKVSHVTSMTKHKSMLNNSAQYSFYKYSQKSASPMAPSAVQPSVRSLLQLSLPALNAGSSLYWFSHSRSLPQKLPEKVLQRLGLEQSKARHLPIHLHARGLVLPGAPGVSLSCPLPRFFLGSLRRLGIQLPE